MPGTGIHGYTGTSSSGKYNIVNGQITGTNSVYDTPATTSGGYPIANRNGAVLQSNSALGGVGSSPVTNRIAGMMAGEYGELDGMSGIAQSIADLISSSNSDYADLVREILANQDANTAKSQAFAREQMDYQTRSDAAAMSWSAAEAQKNRDWQERLSDTAHQREVKDLLAAGLNPILSANAGAHTGSGATGQGFSSSGAMGSVDTSGSGAMASLFSTVMNTASQAAIARIYTDAERYNADLQFGAAKMATEASILNNQNSNSAQREIAMAGYANDIEKANIQGAYNLRSMEMSTASNEAISAGNNQFQKEKTMYEAKQQKQITKKTLEAELAKTQMQVENGSLYSVGGLKTISDTVGTLANMVLNQITGNPVYKNYWDTHGAKDNTEKKWYERFLGHM